jgi:DNA-binding NtrC family response regulator
MQLVNVVIASSDVHTASQLAISLHPHFRSVAVARTVDDMRRAIPKHRAEVAIVDLEMASLKDVAELCHDGQTQVVCTHRIPDEKMWAQALSAGALDCCHNTDVDGIVDAVQRNIRAKAHAA